MCVKSTVLCTLHLWNGKDPDPYQTVGSDPYQIEKQDPDPYQSEKQDPDPYQKGLDPQYWFMGHGVTTDPVYFWTGSDLSAQTRPDPDPT